MTGLGGGDIQTRKLARTKEIEQKHDNTNNDENNAAKVFTIVYESIVKTQNEIPEQKTRKKKSRKEIGQQKEPLMATGSLAAPMTML